MKASEVMTANPVCCAKTDTAQEAAMLMEEFEVGVLPVTEDYSSTEIIGMVTDRDLCMFVVKGGFDASSVTLDKCMSRQPVCCSPDDDLKDVLVLMKVHQLHRIPVIDSGKHLKGIVSTTDILWNSDASSEQIADAFREICLYPKDF